MIGAASAAIQEPPPLPTRIDPEAQKLLDRDIQALGGAAFLRFKTASSRGRVFVMEEGETAGFFPYTSDVAYPDKRRFAYGKKKPVILVNNGDRAWELDRYGLTHQTPDQVRRWKASSTYSLENLLRLRIHEPGVLIQAGGVDFVDNQPARLVEVFDRHQVEVKLYLQARTDLPIQIDYRVQNPNSREWEEYTDIYGDYQDIQGVQTPMHIIRLVNGERVLEMFRNSVRYDEDYPPDYFEPPR